MLGIEGVSADVLRELMCIELGTLGVSAGMRVTSRGVLHVFGTLGSVWIDSDAPRSPLHVSTLLGSSVRSDSPEELTAGSGCVLGVSWMLAEVWTLGGMLGTRGGRTRCDGGVRNILREV